MPTYSFLNKETNEEYDIILSMSEIDRYKIDNPHLEQLIKFAPALVDPTRLGLRKPDSGFRDVLKKVKSAHRGAKINTW
jgi:hypothetical protein